MTTSIFRQHQEQLRDDLKRKIACDYARNELGATDPSMWQWAKAYDYVEEQFGDENTGTLASLAQMGAHLRRDAAAAARSSGTADTPQFRKQPERRADARAHVHRRATREGTAATRDQAVFPAQSSPELTDWVHLRTGDVVSVNDDKDKDQQ